MGWVLFGPLGGLLSFLIGYMLESAEGYEEFQTANNQSTASNSRRTASNSRRTASNSQQEGDRNSFLMTMLALAAYIIKADGRVMHSEMELVRRTLRQNFGEAAAVQGSDILLRLFDIEKQQGRASFADTIRRSCSEAARYLDYSGRLQLLNFLVMITQADGRVDGSEVTALKEVAQWMQMSASEVDSMLHLKGDTLDDAYRVLGVSPTATDDELKKAYRRLALEHHPDRVAKLGDDVRQAAEKKFQEINAAKERIWKARGM